MADETSSMIFVGGLQRSGTTLLGRLLASHPAVAGLVGTPTDEDEGQFIQDVFPDDHVMGRPDGGKRGRVNQWAYHPEAHLTESDLSGRPNAATRLTESWRPYWSRPDALRRVEKSPSNVMKTRFLQAVFPGSRYVIVTRHPVTQALAIRKWVDLRHRLGLDFGQMIDHWLTAMETFAADAPSLKHVLTVRYEDLLADGQDVMQRINSFLALPEYEYDVSSLSDRDAVYRSYWENARTGSGRFRPLNPQGNIAHEGIRALERVVMATRGRRDIARAVAAYEDRIGSFGYSFDQIGQS